jgi:hypothetical protein
MPLPASESMRWTIARYAVGIFVFSAAALLNGYPLLYPDSGTYLRSAIELHFPWDRPVFYSIFATLLDLKLSLWPIVVGQSLMTVFIIDRTIATAAPAAGPWYSISFMFLLGTLTSLPWFTGQVMPDLFAPLLILALYLVTAEYARVGRRTYLVLLLFLFVAQSVHYTHVILGAASIVAIGLSSRILGCRIGFPVLMRAGTTTASAIAAIVMVNYLALHQVSFAPSGGIFLLARLIEYGTAQEYLARECDEPRYAICAVRDRLPHTVNDFMWNDDSVVHELGGNQAYAPEAARLAHRIIADAPVRHAMLALRATIGQLTRFSTGAEFRSFGPDDRVYQVIHGYFSGEASQFDRSLEETDALPLAWVNAIHVPVGYALLGINAVLLGLALTRHRQRAALFLTTVFLALGINAFLCGALSSSENRYQSRMMPLLLIACYIGVQGLRRVEPAGGPVIQC